MLAVFAATLFTSSALLFSVEPMIAKMILPLLGGTPAVWNTCMVFYQLVLLAGYLYAHLIARLLSRRRQIMLHAAVVALSVISLPIILATVDPPPTSTSPIPWLIGVLVRTAGAPLFVISSTAPLFQRWFAAVSDRNPYPLYAASNAGSILALIGYPGFLERTLTLNRQSALWSVGYAAFIVLAVICTARLWRRPDRDAAASRSADTTPPPSRTTKARWIVLAVVPSSLMLGVTTFLTTDIAAAPFLWILPLGLYLLTFVLVFAARPIVAHERMVRLLPLFVLPLVSLSIFDTQLPPIVQIALHLTMFFLASMVCHGELARNKPHSDHLTTFYLCLAVGGVIGGIFNAIVAPLVFNTVVEYPLMIVLACMMRPTRHAGASLLADLAAATLLGAATLAVMFAFKGGESKSAIALLAVFVVPAAVCFSFRRRPRRFALGVAALIVASSLYMSAFERVVYRGRSFFSVHRVTLDPRSDFRLLVHGGIVHGAQSLHPERKGEATTYFHRAGPMGQLFDALAAKAHEDAPSASGRDALSASRRVGVVGLGIGTLAAYSRPGEQWTFFEIDPAVADVARDARYFTFLRDARAPIEIVLGDARLSLARVPDGHFDLLVLDAFSSDAIPVHLLTREAFRLYVGKLSPNGVLAFHISNRYVELKPLLGDVAASAGLVALGQDDLRVTPDEMASGKFPSRWLVMARRRSDLGCLASDPRWQVVTPRSTPIVWSDDFSNLLSVFKWRG